MSTSKKPLGKRKRQSPPPYTTSHISRRLEKLRNGRRNLWDDDDEEEEEVEQNVQSKSKHKTPIDNTYIVLNDSGDDKASSKRRSRSHKSKKTSSRIQDENLSSDNDARMTSKCPTCFICSILSTLTSYNCCPNHLSLLKYNKDLHHHHQQKQTTNSDQWPPQQVMILPMTDELMQRYLNSQEIYRLKTRTATSPVQKNATESERSARKLSTMTSEVSGTEQSNIPKSKSSTKATHMETDEISSSSSLIDSSLPDRGPIPADATFTVVSSTSTSTASASFESPTVLNTGQLQQSSDQPILVDDSQPDHQQENSLTKNTNEKKQNNPWTPVSDETYEAIDTALEQVDRNSQEQMEFTPALARRTPTDLMASRLPKIQLKKGRYHQGKPTADKNTSSTTTITNESHSINISQSSSTSVTITNTRPPSSLATIVEDESLIIQSTRQNSEKSSQSCQILSQRHDNTPECLSDTVMSRLFAQDESSQHDVIHTVTKTIPNEALQSLTTIVEECVNENDNSKSVNMSQLSQLTNDQSDTQPFISSTTNEKPTTPARKSYRLNLDGSRVSMSRSGLSTHRQSPSTSSRRTSTDVIHTNK